MKTEKEFVLDRETKEKAWKLSKDHGHFSEALFCSKMKVRSDVAEKICDYVRNRNMDEAQAKMTFKFTTYDEFPEPDKKVLAVCGKSSHGPQFISLIWNKNRGWYSDDEAFSTIRFDHITCWCLEPKVPQDWYEK
jgi:hypothetical protein